jgi:hypothetical protein
MILALVGRENCFLAGYLQDAAGPKAGQHRDFG